MKRKLVIIGTGSFAQVVFKYFEKDSDYNVVGFAQHAPGSNILLNKPLIDLANIHKTFPPNEYFLFVAIGYSKMNKQRQKICAHLIDMGYTLASYVSPYATVSDDLEIGQNVFIFEDNTIQPFVKIANGVILWSGNHIGHHSYIDQYCFVASHAVISGYCKIGARSFIGVNATIIDNLDIGEATLVGAGALITRSTAAGSVYPGVGTKPAMSSSENFFL